MSRIKNVQVFSRKGDAHTDYIMYFEWEGLRFSRVWGLANDAKVDPKYVAAMFEDESQDDVNNNEDEVREIGSPVDRPMPELSDGPYRPRS